MAGLRKRVGKFIVRWRLTYAVVTVAANVLAILTVIFVFPDVSNLWVSIFVLFSGVTSSLTGLADLLTDEDD